MQRVLDANYLHSLARVSRWVLPLVVFLVSLALELREVFEAGHPINELAIFGLLVPLLIWLVTSGLVIGLRQRDVARARLQVLYQISSQVASAPNEAALVHSAAHLVATLLGPVPATLIMRERDDGPWTLAEAWRLQPEQEQALAALLAGQAALPCDHCPRQPGAFVRNCLLLQAMEGSADAPRGSGVICQPLADQQRFHALITAFVDRTPSGLEDLRPLLASFGSSFATALERARLRGRELEVLELMERAARRPDALPHLLNGILAEVARAYDASSSLIYLGPYRSDSAKLALFCAWPEEEDGEHSGGLARRTFESGIPVAEDGAPSGGAIAVPLVTTGVKTGALVLTGLPSGVPLEPLMLQVTAQLIALAVRNSQLTAELEGRAILDERNRLAGEVHDRVAQGLGYLNFKVQQIDQLLQDGQSEAGRQELHEFRKEVKGLYSEVRLTIDDLRWKTANGEGPAARIEQYCRQMAERSGLAIATSLPADLALPPRVEVQLIRILQEAMLNIQRHATARRVQVELSAVDEGLCLTVEDDGQGFLPELGTQPGHFGLRMMEERAAALGGRLAVQSAVGIGTRLVIVVPNGG